MVDFNELIDNYLLREYRPKPIGKYYPSEVGGCLRKTWFSYKQPKKTKADTIKIFEAGNMLHEFVADVIKSEKNPHVELLESELPIKIEGNDFIISGRIDDLILVKIDNERYLVEVKSTKYLPDEYKKAHEMQLQLYMLSTGIHKGIILYIQKDNLQTCWFDINYEEDKVTEILKRFETLHNSLIKEEIPNAEAKQDQELSWMCKNCEYFDECSKIEEKKCKD